MAMTARTRTVITVGAVALCGLYLAKLAIGIGMLYGELSQLRAQTGDLTKMVGRLEATAAKASSPVSFDTSFYRDAITACAIANNVKGHTISFGEGRYAGAMTASVTFPQISSDALRGMIEALSTLGYITDANALGISLQIVEFTRDDAMNQLKTKNEESL